MKTKISIIRYVVQSDEDYLEYHWSLFNVHFAKYLILES